MQKERYILFLTNSGDENNQRTEMVEKTIQNYKSYFKSSYGGWWDESEMIHLEQPEREIISSAFYTLNNSPYSILIFCGPTRKVNDDIYIKVNPDTEVSIDQINQQVNKRILIIDDVLNSKTVNTNGGLDSLDLFKESLYGLVLNTIECKRLLLHKNLKECPNHKIIIHIEKSSISKEIGSYYSAFLLKMTRLMIKEKYQSIDFSSEFGFLRLPRIHENTIELMKKNSLKTSSINIKISNDQINETSDSLVFAIVG